MLYDSSSDDALPAELPSIFGVLRRMGLLSDVSDAQLVRLSKDSVAIKYIVLAINRLGVDDLAEADPDMIRIVFGVEADLAQRCVAAIKQNLSIEHALVVPDDGASDVGSPERRSFGSDDVFDETLLDWAGGDSVVPCAGPTRTLSSPGPQATDPVVPLHQSPPARPLAPIGSERFRPVHEAVEVPEILRFLATNQVIQHADLVRLDDAAIGRVLVDIRAIPAIARALASNEGDDALTFALFEDGVSNAIQRIVADQLSARRGNASPVRTASVGDETNNAHPFPPPVPEARKQEQRLAAALGWLHEAEFISAFERDLLNDHLAMLLGTDLVGIADSLKWYNNKEEELHSIVDSVATHWLTDIFVVKGGIKQADFEATVEAVGTIRTALQRIEDASTLSYAEITSKLNHAPDRAAIIARLRAVFSDENLAPQHQASARAALETKATILARLTQSDALDPTEMKQVAIKLGDTADTIAVVKARLVAHNLDPDNDSHWTPPGLPLTNTVRYAFGYPRRKAAQPLTEAQMRANVWLTQFIIEPGLASAATVRQIIQEHCHGNPVILRTKLALKTPSEIPAIEALRQAMQKQQPQQAPQGTHTRPRPHIAELESWVEAKRTLASHVGTLLTRIEYNNVVHHSDKGMAIRMAESITTLATEVARIEASDVTLDEHTAFLLQYEAWSADDTEALLSSIKEGRIREAINQGRARIGFSLPDIASSLYYEHLFNLLEDSRPCGRNIQVKTLKTVVNGFGVITDEDVRQSINAALDNARHVVTFYNTSEGRRTLNELYVQRTLGGTASTATDKRTPLDIPDDILTPFIRFRRYCARHSEGSPILSSLDAYIGELYTVVSEHCRHILPGRTLDEQRAENRKPKRPAQRPFAAGGLVTAGASTTTHWQDFANGGGRVGCGGVTLGG